MIWRGFETNFARKSICDCLIEKHNHETYLHRSVDIDNLIIVIRIEPCNDDFTVIRTAGKKLPLII